MSSLVGRMLGPYRILAEIGRGGMAVVYRGLDTRSDREVALKVLPPYWEHDQEFVRRFSEEAHRAIALRHPCIVETYETGEADGYRYIAMEYLGAGSLTTRLRQERRFDIDTAARVASDIAAALDYAHDQGIVHRDVKPSNILFNGQGHARLTDFGIARAADQASQTIAGMLVGTPEYMSPEQAQGEPVDKRADIWALGVVLYEMLTGQRPFSGENAHAVLYQIIHNPVRPPSGLVQTLPSALDHIVNQALAKKARQRFSRAGDMAAQVRQLLHEGESATALKPNADPVTRMLRPEGVALEPPATPSTAQKVGMGILALAVTLLLAGLFWRAANTSAGASAPAGAGTPIVATVGGSLFPAPAVAQPTQTPTPPRAAIPSLTPFASVTVRSALVAVTVQPPAVLPPAVATQPAILAPTATAPEPPTDVPPPPPPTVVRPTPTLAPSPVPAPTETPAPVAAIMLLAPPSGSTTQDMVQFTWTASVGLAPGQTYDVRVCKGGGCTPQLGKTNVDQTAWVWCPDAGEEVYRWQVVVIDRATKQDSGPRSNIAQMTWTGGECGGGGGGGSGRPRATSTPR